MLNIRSLYFRYARLYFSYFFNKELILSLKIDKLRNLLIIIYKLQY